jgi:hypothetical protein
MTIQHEKNGKRKAKGTHFRRSNNEMAHLDLTVQTRYSDRARISQRVAPFRIIGQRRRLPSSDLYSAAGWDVASRSSGHPES